MGKKIAVVLSGCGFKDGSEITEAVSSLIAISQAQATHQCFAPDNSFEATDHLSDDPQGQRSTLTESARIARGKVLSLDQLKPDDFDALVFPGGFGAALNLCTWAKQGSKCEVLPDIVRVISHFYEDQKPIGAICIAPVLLAKILGDKEITLTIGNDVETAQEIEKTGAVHENCPPHDFVTDRANRVITTPAYMYDDSSPAQVFQGVSGLIKELVEMA